MFDLFRSRATTMRYLLIVLLSLVALSMVITLIPGFGSPSYGSRNDQVLAEVGSEKVTQRTVAQVIQMQMRNRQMSPEIIGIMLPQIVNQMVGELATAYEARRMGLTVSDQELVQAIQGLMPHLFQNGEFAGREAYQATLAQMNTTIPEFESKVRQNVLLEKLQRIAFDGIIVSPQEVDAELKRKSEKVRLQVVKFDPEEIKKTLKPTDDELREYLKANQAMFQVPAKRTVALVIVDADKLGESLPITDAMVKQAYEGQMERWRSPERVKLRHILIKAEASASAEDKKKAREKAEGLLKQIKGGADFAELAKKNSEDPGSAPKGGDLDWVQRGQTVKPFEDAAFALKPKEISNVVETIFGYHIIQALEKENSRVKPFDEVKGDLLTELRKRQLFDKMPAVADQARAEIVKNPSQAEEVAKKLNLTFAKAEKVGPGSDYPVIGKNQELDQQLAAVAKGGVTPVVQTADNKLIIGSVLDVFPARPGDLNEVREQVKAAYLGKKAADLAEERSKAFETKLKANNNDLAKTAKEMNVKLVDTGEFERGGQMKDVGPAAYFGEQPWVSPVGAVVGPYRVSSTPYWFKVVAKKEGDPASLQNERQAVVSAIKEKKLRERRDLFEEGILSRLKADGKVTVHDDAIKRMASSYRG
ncbi:MAG: peptidylprolyl isomerase [Bryobacterales bacterium]|nr:peptidylprolyl isomerase [Bryobacterales bacterium]